MTDKPYVFLSYGRKDVYAPGVVNPVEQSHHAVPATAAPHGGSFRIGERGHQLAGTRLIVSRKVATRAIDIAVSRSL